MSKILKYFLIILALFIAFPFIAMILSIIPGMLTIFVFVTEYIYFPFHSLALLITDLYCGIECYYQKNVSMDNIIMLIVFIEGIIFSYLLALLINLKNKKKKPKNKDNS